MKSDQYRRSNCGSAVVFMSAVALLAVVSSAQDVGQYRLYERVLTNNNTYGNKIEVFPTVVWTHAGSGETISFYGFYDGDGNGGGNGNIWKIRFMPTKLGEWDYTWSWPDSTPGGTGSINCIATGRGKGVIQACQSNTNWFAYNGTDPVYLKSYYVGAAVQTPIDWTAANIYQPLIDRGYNHMQFNTMLPTEWVSTDYWSGAPWRSSDYLFTNNNPRYNMNFAVWKLIEDHHKWLNDRDIGMHYFQGFTGKHLYTHVDFAALSASDQAFYIKYTCARLAPFANVAGFCFTWETGDGTTERRFVDLLDEYDPWDHLRTMMRGSYDENEARNGAWNYGNYNFVSTEVVGPYPGNPGHRNGCDQTSQFVYDLMKATSDYYDKPVFHSECWGMWHECYGACETSVRRTAWANAMAAVSATWDWDTANCLAHPQPSGMFSSAADEYIDIQTDVMMNEVQFNKLNCYPQVNNGAKALAEPGKQYVVYKEGGGQFNLTVASSTYEGKWVNCVTGQKNDIGTVTGTGGSMSFTSPFGGTDAALVLAQPINPCDPSPLDAIAVGQAQIDLSWRSDGSCSELNYRIERNDGGGLVQIAQVAANTTAYSDTGLTADTSYTYRVRADLGGGSFENSNEATATTHPAPPAAPSNLVATAQADALVIDLLWQDNASNEAGFRIERMKDGAPSFTEIDTVGADEESYADSIGLEIVTTYTYRVLAYNAGGESAYTNVDSATTPFLADPIKVDDADIPPMSYTGTWSAKTGEPTRYMGTLHESDSAGSTASLAVTCTSFKIYGDKRNWGGEATVTIDSVSQGTISYQGPDEDSVLIAEFTGLSCGEHTIVLTVNGGGWCYLDYIEYQPCTGGPDNIPADPTNLVVTMVSDEQLDLSWTDNSGMNNDDAELFYIERRLASGGSYQVLTDVPGTTTTYSDTGLSYSTEYCYRVIAWNAIGYSAHYSNEDCELTAGPPDPQSPSNLEAQPVGGKVILTWDANTETDPAVLYYIVSRAEGSGGPYSPVAVAFMGTNITDSQVVNDVEYCYKLKAVDTFGHQSSDSDPVCATPHQVDLPASPSNLSATAVSHSQIDLSWLDNSDNETGFRIERTSDGYSTTVGANVTGYSDTGLAGSTTYTYKVYAYNVDGDSLEPNPTSSATTDPSPGPNPPSHLTATAISANQIVTVWHDNSGDETGFAIERNDGGGYSQVGTVGVNVTSYVDGGLTANTTYTYRVKATGSPEDSDYSNESTETTPVSGGTGNEVTLDDADAQIVYGGSWNPQSGWGGRYQTTLHESEDVNATATLVFTGVAVELIAERHDWGGQAEVFIDDASQGIADFTGVEQLQIPIMTITGLSAGEHTFRMEKVSGGWIYVDAIKYTEPSGPALPP